MAKLDRLILESEALCCRGLCELPAKWLEQEMLFDFNAQNIKSSCCL